MRLLKLFVGVMLSAGLLTGCSKHESAKEAGTPKSVNLGTIELSSGQPSRHDLGDGFACIITASSLDASSLEVISALEKAGKKISSTRSAPVLPDRPLDVSFGDIQVQFTPHLK